EQRLYINHSAYFRGVSQEIYDYRIGGYCVLDKYLKSHKNESCDFDHVTRIIKVIARTIEIQKTLGFLTSDLPHLKGNDSKALMQEILQNPPPPFNTNTALILSRQAKASLDFDAAFISKEASDLNISSGGGGTAFPLFCIT
uniref:type ISP restriction/modification enzyme n=1 Tax=Helicobacter pylori TaxID=210 RepID=UPI00051B6571